MKSPLKIIGVKQRKEMLAGMRRLGFDRDIVPIWVVTLLIMVATLLTGGLLLWAWLRLVQPGSPPSTEHLGLVVGLAVFLAGLHQWVQARAEYSLEKYYERLNMSNELLNRWESARALLGQYWEDNGTYERLMYVYVELDNLEYCLEKYRRGYMNTPDAYRGLRTFYSRCMSPEFRRLAVIHATQAGYKPEIIRIVESVAQNIERQATGDPVAPGSEQADVAMPSIPEAAAIDDAQRTLGT